MRGTDKQTVMKSNALSIEKILVKAEMTKSEANGQTGIGMPLGGWHH